MNIQLYFVISRGFLKLDGGRCQRNLRKTSKKKKNAHPSSSVSNSEWVFHCGQVTQEEVLVVVTSSSTHVECILRMVWNGGMKEIQDTRLPTQLPLSWLQISFLSPENQKKIRWTPILAGVSNDKKNSKTIRLKFQPHKVRSNLGSNPSYSTQSIHYPFPPLGFPVNPFATKATCPKPKDNALVPKREIRTSRKMPWRFWESTGTHPRPNLAIKLWHD